MAFFAHYPASGDHHIAHHRAAAGKDERVRDRIAAAAGEIDMLLVEHYEVGAHSRRDRTHAAAERLRAAGGGLEPKRSADSRVLSRRPEVAFAQRDPLQVLEKAQLLGGIAGDVAVAADAVAPARSAVLGQGEDAVAEIALGGRAKAGDR